jgi:hypothetical protein
MLLHSDELVSGGRYLEKERPMATDWQADWFGRELWEGGKEEAATHS